MKGLSTQVRYMVGMVVDATGSGMYLPLSLLYFHHTTGLPITTVGAVVSAAALVGLVSNPLTGVLVDRYGARTVVVGGYLLRAAAFATYPLVDSAVPLFLVVTVVAFGDVSFSPSIHSLIAEITQGSARDKLIAAQRSLRNAGLGVGGLIASVALAASSERAYNVIVLSSGAAFLLAAAMIRSIPTTRATRTQRGMPEAPAGYRLVLRNRPFMGLTLLNVPTAFGYMVLSVSLPIYITLQLGAPTSMVGTLYAVNTVGIALLQIPVTRIITRYRRTRAAAAGACVFAMSFVTFAVLGAASAGTVLMVGVFVATAMFTAGELLHGATASALVVNAAPEQTRGRHIAVYQLSWALPTALAPAVLTGLLSLSAVGMWLVLALGALVAAAGVLRLEPRLPHEAVYPQQPVPAQSATPPGRPLPAAADEARLSAATD